MNADDALREMRERARTRGPEICADWADAIDAELKALREKVAMLERKPPFKLDGKTMEAEE